MRPSLDYNWTSVFKLVIMIYKHFSVMPSIWNSFQPRHKTVLWRDEISWGRICLQMDWFVSSCSLTHLLLRMRNKLVLQPLVLVTWAHIKEAQSQHTQAVLRLKILRIVKNHYDKWKRNTYNSLTIVSSLMDIAIYIFVAIFPYSMAVCMRVKFAG